MSNSPIRVLVCGGRDFGIDPAERYFVQCTLDDFARDRDVVIIHGGAKGVDSVAGGWAKIKSWTVELYRANWAKYGPRAGPIRNRQMLYEGKPDIVLAFPGGKGTAHMSQIAKSAGIDVIQIEYTKGH